MSAAPTNPAPGSTSGSRVVTTDQTSSHTTAAAARKPRLVSRSRASITTESRVRQRATLAGQMSRNAQYVHARESGFAV